MLQRKLRCIQHHRGHVGIQINTCAGTIRPRNQFNDALEFGGYFGGYGIRGHASIQPVFPMVRILPCSCTDVRC